MDIKFTVITLALLQLFLITFSEAANSRHSGQHLLQQTFMDVMYLTDKTFAEQTKNLSKSLLKDQIMQQPSSKFLKDFKLNITNYLIQYPAYERYSLYNQLVTIFGDLTMKFYYREARNHSDSQTILKLLKKYGYDNINDKYEREFLRFVKGKCVITFEKFAKKLPKAEQDLRENLLEWAEEAKECKDYDCADDKFNLLNYILYTEKDDVFVEIFAELQKNEMIYANKFYKLMKSLLKDPQLMKLNNNLNRNLTKDIQYFIRKYVTNKDIDKLSDILDICINNITSKYYENMNIPVKDRQLLKEIFDGQGYGKMLKKYENSLKDFIHHGLTNIFENYKASITKKELAKEKPLLQWYENIKGLNSYQDITKAIVKLYDLMEE